MSNKAAPSPNSITALKVHQWLPSWDKVHFNEAEDQAKPKDKHFLLFSIKASHLKALTGVYRRSTKGGTARALDPNVQRGHEEERSETIRDFVQYGFPWCEMSETRREQDDANDLRKPGWLPTAILVNILPPKARRNGIEIPADDLVAVENQSSTSLINLPKHFNGSKWKPKKVFPLEVIDGQHRLWAFEDFNENLDFEIPVVAFYGLAPGWQAYLFWSVNITPKKINRSLAFDLYPLLRQQTWLEKFSGHRTYRETRCQELVEALWSHPDSPWHQRINMLGEAKIDREYKGPSATQAAWVRSLFHTMVKQWEGVGTRIGGLFGAPSAAHELVLPWNRPMQVAFLIFAATSFKNHIKATKAPWAEYLREINGKDLFKDDDPAFYGEYSLISTDQGIRGFLFVINDLCFVQSKQLNLEDWRWDDVKTKKASATEEAPVSAAVKSFSNTAAAVFLDSIAKGIATYDWRTSSTPSLPDKVRLQQAVFRGSSGYKEMRHQLLEHLVANGSAQVSKAAKTVKQALGY